MTAAFPNYGVQNANPYAGPTGGQFTGFVQAIRPGLKWSPQEAARANAEGKYIRVRLTSDKPGYIGLSYAPTLWNMRPKNNTEAEATKVQEANQTFFFIDANLRLAGTRSAIEAAMRQAEATNVIPAGSATNPSTGIIAQMIAGRFTVIDLPFWNNPANTATISADIARATQTAAAEKIEDSKLVFEISTGRRDPTTNRMIMNQFNYPNGLVDLVRLDRAIRTNQRAKRPTHQIVSKTTGKAENAVAPIKASIVDKFRALFDINTAANGHVKDLNVTRFNATSGSGSRTIDYAPASQMVRAQLPPQLAQTYSYMTWIVSEDRDGMLAAFRVIFNGGSGEFAPAYSAAVQSIEQQFATRTATRTNVATSGQALQVPTGFAPPTSRGAGAGFAAPGFVGQPAAAAAQTSLPQPAGFQASPAGGAFGQVNGFARP